MRVAARESSTSVPYQVYQTAEDFEAAVVPLIDELRNPDTKLHRQFYDPQRGIARPGLRETLEVHGHRMFIQDETEHSVQHGRAGLNVAAFKRRTMLAAVLVATRDNPDAREFVTFSAGNAGLGLAAAAMQLGKRATIFCAQDLSPVKERKLLTLGAKIVKRGHRNLEDARDRAYEVLNGSVVLIHPYDQPAQVAGAATIALEIEEGRQELIDAGQLDAAAENVVTASVGGASLLSALAIANKTYDFGWRVVGAQLEGCDAALRHRRRIEAGEPTSNLFAPGELVRISDGTAVDAPGHNTGLIASDKRYVDDLMTVNIESVAQTMRRFSYLEVAGALGYTLAHQLALATTERATFTSILSGANSTPQRYQEVQRLAGQGTSDRPVGRVGLSVMRHGMR